MSNSNFLWKSSFSSLLFFFVTICLVLTKFADEKWKSKIKTPYINQSTHFGGRKSLTPYSLVAIFVFPMYMINQIEPLQFNEPSLIQLMVPMRQALIQSTLFACYVILLIQKSPTLKSKIKSYLG